MDHMDTVTRSVGGMNTVTRSVGGMNTVTRSVGGLTVAFGIAAAVSVALADPASAAPVGVSADDSAHANRTPRSNPVRRTPQVSAAAARQPVPHLPAASVRADRRSVRTAVAPTTAPSAATASKPYPRWDSRGRLITIYKGTHFVIPNRWALWVTKESGDATFTADSAYDLKDEDQYDWNKLGGITFTPWRPDRNSSMVVWRYNLQNGMYEIGPFFNVDFAYVFPDDDQIITVPADQMFSYTVDYNGISVSYGDITVHKATPGDLKPNFWTSARVTGWFGGSEVAPRTVSYYQRLT
jgi:hypothetical protein